MSGTNTAFLEAWPDHVTLTVSAVTTNAPHALDLVTIPMIWLQTLRSSRKWDLILDAATVCVDQPGYLCDDRHIPVDMATTPHIGAYTFVAHDDSEHDFNFCATQTHRVHSRSLLGLSRTSKTTFPHSPGLMTTTAIAR
ncbi:BZ3500_MvSof-1268-A1-R1_Chr5-2g07991 [Microbotryum saponariae]|uniref:BZ3500_MvSof-1268-A1-R1_Chr5-2g07991 protein n=1 Tax=Microbotryum saponariae TaxID=289078 RepID=A0A2X0L9Z9_9BASI|nr:BZ3500_MvSof-1268-A1-R1_Chr5-2g07991 [Microbotryum saponariae]SDA05860.1 BZ3501_MvSof-1269-A2-R1_Chr5-2g07813 [Microbotryum saponariae]